jgi:hypothetical protein
MSEVPPACSSCAPLGTSHCACSLYSSTTGSAEQELSWPDFRRTVLCGRPPPCWSPGLSFITTAPTASHTLFQSCTEFCIHVFCLFVWGLLLCLASPSLLCAGLWVCRAGLPFELQSSLPCNRLTSPHGSYLVWLGQANSTSTQHGKAGRLTAR